MAKDQVVQDVCEFADELSKEMGKASAMIVKLRACGAGNDIGAEVKLNSDSLEKLYEAIKQLTTKEVTDPTKYRKLMEDAIEPYKLLKKYIRAGQAVVNQVDGPRKRKGAFDNDQAAKKPAI